jgi:hypothetical protein
LSSPRLARRTFLLAVFVAIALVAAIQVVDTARDGDLGDDFDATIWLPAEAVVDGITPYPEVDRSSIARSVYPPAAFLPVVPLTPLPRSAVRAIWTALLLASAILTLHVLGVRDRRCFAVWLLSAPVVWGLALGSATLIVVLAVALNWRYRHSAIVSGAALACAVAIKLFVLPVVGWLVVTRRYRSAAITLVFSLALIVGSWAAIGFDGFLKYPERMRQLSADAAEQGLLLRALLEQAGMQGGDAMLAAGLAATLAFGLGVVRRQADLVSFTWFLVGALLLCPLAWIHYLGLMVVPLAAKYPRFHPAWLLLPLLWVRWGYSPLERGSVQLSLAALLITTLLGVAITHVEFGRGQRRTTFDNAVTAAAQGRGRNGSGRPGDR